MGQQLYRGEPAFRDAIRRCSASSERVLGFSLSDFFEGVNQAPAGSLEEGERREVVIHSAIELGQCDLWRAYGVEPDACVGVSGGEVAAAYAAGALTLEESAEVLCSVALVVTQRPLKGHYIWFDLAYAEALRLSAECPARLDVFIDTSPCSCIAYCTSEDLAEVRSFLSERCAIRNTTETEWAHHTPWAEAAAATAENLYRPRPLPLAHNLYSPVAGGLIPAGAVLDPDYWYRAAITPIMFGRALCAALTDGHDVILNVCSHPGLQVLELCAKAVGRRVSVIDTMNACEPELATWDKSRHSLRALGLMGAREGRSGDGRVPAAPGPAATDIDLLRHDVLRNPYPHYAALARSGPAHFLPRHGFWLVLGYDDVAQALRNPRDFSSVRPGDSFDPVLIDADPPEHTRARRSLAPYFSAHPASALEDYARECARGLLAEGDKGGGFDIVNDFAIPLSQLVIGRFLGIPHEETAALGRELRARDNQLQDLSPLLSDWSRKYVEGLRGSAREDVCSRLLRGEGDKALTTEEVASLLKLLWAAGTLTPGISIATSALLLLRHPDARRELQSDLSLMPAFVEESLRLEA
ncbi:MAG TPA: acyltransferase domain-containing protein, partial [Pyrinomonadaceae bacterium]